MEGKRFLCYLSAAYLSNYGRAGPPTAKLHLA
jgi:hypothetical protein